jgi:hypothetical protein
MRLLVHQVRSNTESSVEDGPKSGKDVRSSQEYETTDDDGSVHSFSSLVGNKTRSFADVVKSTPPASPEHHSHIRQVRACSYVVVE